MTTRLVHWWHNGFHGRRLLSCRVPLDAKPGDIVGVPPATARRLNRSVCGCQGCMCAESAAYLCGPRRWQMMVPEEYSEIKGHYPQQ